MGVVKFIGYGDQFVVEALVARLVSTDQKYRRASWIESVKYAQRLAIP
jgi:hypothetical protein